MTYGYWGAFTESGQYYYDEMDAMYPFFALVIAALLLFLFSCIYAYGVYKGRPGKN
jgi:hypothetical protein